MHTLLKTLLVRFLVTLGSIFFVLLCVGAYVWFADPFGIRPLVQALSGAQEHTPRAAQLQSGTTTNQRVDGHPLLTPAQEEVLSKVGIDPALIPREITPEQDRCLRETLTPTRVEELLAGDLPTIPEIAAARPCFTSPLD